MEKNYILNNFIKMNISNENITPDFIVEKYKDIESDANFWERQYKTYIYETLLRPHTGEINWKEEFMKEVNDRKQIREILKKKYVSDSAMNFLYHVDFKTLNEMTELLSHIPDTIIVTINSIYDCMAHHESARKRFKMYELFGDKELKRAIIFVNNIMEEAFVGELNNNRLNQIMVNASNFETQYWHNNSLHTLNISLDVLEIMDLILGQINLGLTLANITEASDHIIKSIK